MYTNNNIIFCFYRRKGEIDEEDSTSTLARTREPRSEERMGGTEEDPPIPGEGVTGDEPAPRPPGSPSLESPPRPNTCAVKAFPVPDADLDRPPLSSSALNLRSIDKASASEEVTFLRSACSVSCVFVSDDISSRMEAMDSAVSSATLRRFR